MLDTKIINKIEEFVYLKPRSIQEIATHLKKNWRTADRYIKEIETEYGTISTRIFRKGTRGALKVVYWASIEKASHSIFQEKLEKEILAGKKKNDFSAFDMFQHVPRRKRENFVQHEEDESIKDFADILLKAKKQILFFSGNLSFINIKDKKKDMMETFEKLVGKNVKIKILCRVDLAGKENIERVLSLNQKHGKNLIEIRHDTHPIRGAIIDDKLIRLKEVSEPTGKIKELNKKIFIFYNIYDKDWTDWLSKIFWKKFSNSVTANIRLEHLNQIKL